MRPLSSWKGAIPDPSPALPSRLDAVYAWVIQLADRLATTPALGLAALGACLGLVLLVAVLVLDRFPNSGDEYAYLYQAQTLAAGRLWNPAPPGADLFGSYYIVAVGDRMYSSFPVGWPLVLAAALWAGTPAWLVNPAAGALSLWVLFLLGRLRHGARVAAIATAVTGTSAFFVFNAASYFSHTWTGLCVLVAAYAAARADDGSPRWPLVAGAAIGWAVVARYYTGVACAIPIVALLLERRQRPVSTLGWLAAGGLPFSVALAAYSAALTGSPWQLTTLDETYGNWFAVRWYLRGFDIFATQLLRYVLWAPPLLVFLYAASRWREGQPRDPLTWMPWLLVLAFFPYINRGGNQYGPRFYYEAYPFLVLAVCAWVFEGDRLASAGQRARFAALAWSVALAPLSAVALGAVEHRVVQQRQDLYRTVTAAGLDDALVLIAGRVGSTRSMDGRDLTRNGLAVDGPVLYVVDLGDAESCRLNAAHYRRRLVRYAWDATRRQGTLTDVRCPIVGPATP